MTTSTPSAAAAHRHPSNMDFYTDNGSGARKWQIEPVSSAGGSGGTSGNGHTYGIGNAGGTTGLARFTPAFSGTAP